MQTQAENPPLSWGSSRCPDRKWCTCACSCVHERVLSMCMCTFMRCVWSCVCSGAYKYAVEYVYAVVYVYVYVYMHVNVYVYGRPTPKVTPNNANKLFTQFKAPSTSSKCKKLDFISKPLTFAGNSAFWGPAWGPVRSLHPLWQGKGAFLNLHQSTLASGYKHH